jgi:hypothetical protein
LTVAIEIQLAKSNAARDRLLVDAGRDHGVMPRDFAREADVDRDEFHGATGLSGQSPHGAGAWLEKLDAGFVARIQAAHADERTKNEIRGRKAHRA